MANGFVPEELPIQGQNTVLAPEPAPPAPPIEAAPMVQQAIEAPTFSPQDRQARFDSLKEEARKGLEMAQLPGGQQVVAPTGPALPFQTLSYPGKSLDEAAEDIAMDKLLAEDQEVDQFQAQARAEQEATKAAENERASRASQLGISLPTEVVKQAEAVVATPTGPEIFNKELEIREQNATQAAQKRVASRQLAKAADDEEKVKQVASQKVEEAELTTLPEIFQKGSWGQKLGAALAVLAGGYSQGLTGAKSNPVLDFMEKNFEQVMQKRKARSDEKAALEAAFWKSKEFDLAVQDARRKGRLTDAQVADLQAKRLAKVDEAELKLLNKLRLKQGMLTDPMELGKEDAERAVRLPDGSYRLATNKTQARKLEDYRAEVEPALSGIIRLKEIGKTYSQLNPVGRAAADTELSAIVGALRLPITGPGVLTDSEREMLKEIIGNPLRISSLSIIENKKLNTIQNKLDTDLKKRYSNAGINLPSTREEQAVQYLMKNHNFSQEKATDLVNKRLGR